MQVRSTLFLVQVRTQTEKTEVCRLAQHHPAGNRWHLNPETGIPNPKSILRTKIPESLFRFVP